MFHSAFAARLGLCAVTLSFAITAAQAEPTFVPGDTQYIAALGPSSATSGTDAQAWGFWSVDPGPRGVWIANYDDLLADAGLAPDG